VLKMKTIFTEDWWSDLDQAGQAAYIKAHPQSQKAQDAKEKGGDNKQDWKTPEGAMSYIHTDTPDGKELKGLLDSDSLSKKDAIRAMSLLQRSTHGAGPEGEKVMMKIVKDKYVGESITINGKQYRPLTESLSSSDKDDFNELLDDIFAETALSGDEIDSAEDAFKKMKQKGLKVDNKIWKAFKKLKQADGQGFSKEKSATQALIFAIERSDLFDQLEESKNPLKGEITINGKQYRPLTESLSSSDKDDFNELLDDIFAETALSGDEIDSAEDAFKKMKQKGLKVDNKIWKAFKKLKQADGQGFSKEKSATQALTFAIERSDLFDQLEESKNPNYKFAELHDRLINRRI